MFDPMLPFRPGIPCCVVMTTAHFLIRKGAWRDSPIGRTHPLQPTAMNPQLPIHRQWLAVAERGRWT